MQRSCTMGKKDINRLKVVLVEQKHTARGVAEQVRRAPATVSKWCTNTRQTYLEIEEFFIFQKNTITL